MRELQHHVATGGVGAAACLHLLDLLPDHQPHDLPLRQAGGRQRRRDGAALAHHRDAVADREHLLQPVRDEDQTVAGVAQPRHHLEQALHLARAQRGGRLVEDDERRVERERLGDLDELTLRRGEPSHLLRERQAVRLAETVEDVAGALPQHAAPQPAGAAQLGEKDVLDHGEIGREAGFLHHHRDARADRIARRLRVERRAAEPDAAAVAPHMPADHPRQRGLAGAVRPEERVHFRARDLQSRTGERARVTEGLLDVTRAQQRRGAGGGRRYQASSPAKTVWRIVGRS